MSSAPTEDGDVGAPTAAGEEVDKRRVSGVEDDDDPLVIDEENEKAKASSKAEAPQAEEDGTTNTDEDNEEKEFEPTVDMLMNEFDDEATIDEEEALGQEDEGIFTLIVKKIENRW